MSSNYWTPRTREMPSAFGSANRTREMSSAFGSGGGTRGMPSAFCNGDRDSKRAEAAAAAARQAAIDRAKKIEADKEAARLADASNFASETSYPALGGAAKVAPKHIALNFKKTVETMVTTVAAEEASERKQNEAHLQAVLSNTRGKGNARVPVKTAHNPHTDEYYDEDDEYCDEDDDYDEDYQEMAYGGDEEEGSDGEFNTDLGSSRRRGDHGVW